jgi:hypothetical protein
VFALQEVTILLPRASTQIFKNSPCSVLALNATHETSDTKLFSYIFLVLIKRKPFGLDCHLRNPGRFRGWSSDAKWYNVCSRVGRIILIKATGEIVLLCRLLTDPFIRAILSSSPYLLHPGYVIPMWCHSASAYEKSTPLHSYTLHTSHPSHPINSRRNYRISNIQNLSPNKDFSLCSSFTKNSLLHNCF